MIQDPRCLNCEAQKKTTYPTTIGESSGYICEECYLGVKKDRCIISNAPGVADAYYCEECVQMGKDRDGCPCVINIGNLQKAVNELKRKENPTG